MSANIFEDKVLEELEERLKKLEELKSAFPFLSDKIDDLRRVLYNQLRIIIFGDVNTGKSSFINALFCEKLCKTDIDITTDKITIFKYAEKPFEKFIGKEVMEIGLNKEILRNLIIIDTPGVSSIKEEHTKIAESFLPKSDVIFITLHPYYIHAKHIWEWVGKILKNYKDRIIFVISFKDLVNNNNINKIVKSVKNYAIGLGIKDPKIFVVSSVLELEGKNKESGFEELRAYLSNQFSGENLKRLKYDIFSQKYEDVLINLSRIVEDNLQKKKREFREIEAHMKHLRELREKLLRTIDEVVNKIRRAEKYKETLDEYINKHVESAYQNFKSIVKRLQSIDVCKKKLITIPNKCMQPKFVYYTASQADDKELLIENGHRFLKYLKHFLSFSLVTLIVLAILIILVITGIWFILFGLFFIVGAFSFLKERKKKLELRRVLNRVADELTECKEIYKETIDDCLRDLEEKKRFLSEEIRKYENYKEEIEKLQALT